MSAGAESKTAAMPKEEHKPMTERSHLAQNWALLQEAYGSASHATYVKHADADHAVVTDYDPMKLSSFRVCCARHGTIMTDPVLLSEQFLVTLIFVMAALPVYIYFREDAAVSKHDASVKTFIREQEGKMRAFAMIMTTLAAFLLSFYTSVVVGRWWTMRTAGVGAIKASTVDLELLLYQGVTRQKEVLSAVRRYGRASLMLIFLWRQTKMTEAELRAALVREETSEGEVWLLTDDEVEQLLKWKHCLHETIWAWQAGIVQTLYNEGKIKSDQLYKMLLEKCTEGRAAAQCVHTHLAVRVPMQYVHLLGTLVKMHNFVLAAIMGLLFGAAVRQRQLIIMVQLFGRTLILPFLFNAILLMNVDLADPFNGSETDFPGIIYQDTINKDCKGIMDATDNMPKWLHDRYEKSAGSP
jgi:hypothetical protein